MAHFVKNINFPIIPDLILGKNRFVILSKGYQIFITNQKIWFNLAWIHIIFINILIKLVCKVRVTHIGLMKKFTGREGIQHIRKLFEYLIFKNCLFKSIKKLNTVKTAKDSLLKTIIRNWRQNGRVIQRKGHAKIEHSIRFTFRFKWNWRLSETVIHLKGRKPSTHPKSTHPSQLRPSIFTREQFWWDFDQVKVA